MKILNAMLSSGKGGMEQMSITYIKALKQIGHEVHALYIKNTPYLTELRNLDINIHLIKHRSILNPFNAVKINHIVHQIHPDIIFLHGNRIMKFMNYPMIKYFFKHSALLIGKAHNFTCKHLANMDYAIATTRYWQNQQSFITGKEVFYLPNTVPLTPKREVVFHKIPVIGTMSRLHKNKSYDIFLKALKVLKDRHITFKAIIGGEGPEKETLLKLRHELELEKDVSFIGWVTDKESFYEMIDIFCLPSCTEPFGTVLLEAMIRSCPVVSTECIGPKEIIESNTSGITCPVGDVRKLADSLERMIRNPAEALRMGQNGREVIEKNYNFQSFCSSLDKLIQRVILKS